MDTNYGTPLPALPENEDDWRKRARENEDALFLDECAMRAMQALIGGAVPPGTAQIRHSALSHLLETTAARSYDFADAMLAERNRRRA